MRVLFVAPYALDVPGGNSTALRRLIEHLARLVARGGGRLDAEVTT